MSSKISVSRQCQFCGNVFLARTTVTKFCNTQCASRGYKKRIKEEKIVQSNQLTILAIGDRDKVREESKEVLTVRAAADLLDYGRSSIYDMIHSGILRARNFGQRKIRILKSDIFTIFESPQLDFFRPTSKKVKVLESDTQLTKDNCYSIGDLIALFGKTRSDLYTFLKRHNIPKIKIGKEVFWAQASVDALFRKWKQPKKLGLQRKRCNDNAHYNFYKNVLLNNDKIENPGREKAMSNLSEDITQLIIYHLSYLFYINKHYMMSSDYRDYLDVGETPPKDSEYWVATFIQNIFNDQIKTFRPDVAKLIREKTTMHLE